MRDENDLAVDEEGLELRDVAAVIEVRDETGPVLQVNFIFEIGSRRAELYA